MAGWNLSLGNSLVAGVAFKSIAILGAARLAAWLLRGRSAAVRHLVWTSASAALLALPLLSLILPALPVPVARELLPSGAVFRVSGSLAATAAVTPSARPGAIPAPAAPAPWRPDWSAMLILLWAAGASAALTQAAFNFAAMKRVRRNARKFPGIDACVLGTRAPVEILETERGSMPMAFGLLRPAVFLPADASEWDAERRRLVLLHELAHVSRGDLATHLLARAAVSFYWWNPLMWHAWREFLKERERAADDLVLQAGARASDYAGHLLEIARTMQSSPAMGWAAVAMARPSQLEGRLLAILDGGVDRNPPRRASAWAAALVALVVAAPFAALQAQDTAATLPADVDATIRAAVSQKNHDMLESAAKAAEALLKYDMARTLLDSSLAIREQTSGQQSVAYGVGLLKIGDLERSRNNFTESEAFYTKAVSVLGSRPEAAPALVDLGLAAMRKKDRGMALDYFQRAQVADPAHAGRALMWMALAREPESPEEADSLFKQALTVQNPNSPEGTLTSEVYGLFLRRHGRTDEASVIQEQAAAERKAQDTQAPLAVRRAETRTVLRVGNGVSAPALLSRVEPQYSEEARLAKYQGTVVVSVTVGPDGKAQDMKVIRGLGLGLDEKAMQAISQWTFKPGTKDGEPVPVMATIEVNFRLL